MRQTLPPHIKTDDHNSSIAYSLVEAAFGLAASAVQTAANAVGADTVSVALLHRGYIRMRLFELFIDISLLLSFFCHLDQ